VATQFGWVAQLAEQRTENPRVGGSIPPPARPHFHREKCAIFSFEIGRLDLDKLPLRPLQDSHWIPGPALSAGVITVAISLQGQG
jgi:hypothetical protein